MNDPIFFYGKKYYMFSNFSSFAIEWKGKVYMTSEHVYQSEKFEDGFLQEEIRMERSAHTAFTRAQELRKDHIRSDWDAVKVSVMKEILHHKVTQHSFVRDTLMSTEERDIIEDSPVDAFWGWGPNKDGKNMLGKLWMEVREEVRKSNDL